MAEIKIEKKKNNWLPWLLAVIGLVLLAWLAVDLFDKDGEPELATADEVNFPDAHITDKPENDRLNAKVNDANITDDVDTDYDGANESFDENMKLYISDIENFSANMNLEHDYSNKVLRSLANSIYALARENKMTSEANVKAATDKIRANAKEITEDWKETDHADLIKEAALASVNVLETIQKEEYPELAEEINELKEAANDINKSTLTLDQKKSVKEFFEKAGEVLEEMRK